MEDNLAYSGYRTRGGLGRPSHMINVVGLRGSGHRHRIALSDNVSYLRRPCLFISCTMVCKTSIFFASGAFRCLFPVNRVRLVKYTDAPGDFRNHLCQAELSPRA